VTSGRLDSFCVVSDMYDLQLSDEQRAIRDTVRDFVAQEIKPFALKPENLEPFERKLPMALLDEASAIGLRTLALSEEAGGAGADALTCCIVAEELAVGDVDLASVLAETAVLGGMLFERLMSPAQRDRFQPRFLDGRNCHLALADHEPGADTTLGVNYHRPIDNKAAIATNAVRARDGDWLVNGVKDHVANAPVAQLFAVEVRIAAAGSDAGSAAMLLVPREAPGLSVREVERPDAHGSSGDLVLCDCRVPAANLLGAASVGHRPPVAEAINLGIGRAAYEAALDYARLRVQGGRRLIEHQAIGTRLAEIAVRLAAARAMIWQAAWASDHPEAAAECSLGDLPLLSAVRVFTSEAVYRAVKDAAECFGAMGVMRDMPLQKYVRDARVCLHAGNGNSEAKLRIAEALAGYSRS
jgi:alkylation response protein AidB-like acyl-CoA dehydrogenase